MAAHTDTMSSLADVGFTLPRHRKVVLVIDLVESVSLMQADELGTIERWQALLAHATRDVLPTHKGRLVKSLGDGLMVEFDEARHAAAAALALHEWMARECPPLAVGSRLALRAGMHVADVYSDGRDLYGTGVNLAARVATLAEPGGTVVTAEVHDGLEDGLECDFEDMGDCWLKHIEEPVRAYRLAPRGSIRVVPQSTVAPPSLRPTIAIMPFDSGRSASDLAVVGDLIADGIIAQLSKTEQLHVVSRLSTRALVNCESDLRGIATHLNCDYVVSGSFSATGGRLMVNAELAHAASGQVIWADRRMTSLDDLFNVRSETVDEFALAVHGAVLNREVALASAAPIPTLSSYSLMLGGINLMHRSARDDFGRSRAVLEQLVERHQRHPLARAWLAKWYVLSATRGLSAAPRDDAARALDQTRRALDSDPANALALAMEGFVYCHLVRDFDTASARLDAAVTHNPSEPLAWLFLGMVRAFTGDGRPAVAASLQARRLSPLDPLSYYYESLSASMALVNRDYDDAIALAQSSLRRNAIHASTYRALAMAQVLSGRVPDAKKTIGRLLTLDPSFSLSRFRRSYAGADRDPDLTKTFTDALRVAGVPE